MTPRQRAIAFFVAFCVVLVAATLTLNIGWIIVNGRRFLPLVLGIITFALIIAGIILYTVFLVLEIRRNEQHDSFINAVTHELKTPIASIRLYLETLQSREVSDDQRREFYRIMLADTDRLQGTVEQVLKAGVASHKGGRRGRVRINLGSLVADSVELARLRHHLAADALRLEATGTDLFVRGDPDDIRTIVTNLLDNAVKYSRDHVDVTVEVAAPTPDTVWVRVRDHGVGIPKRQLRRIFNRFYRVQARGLRHVKGTGLGLYIARTLARQQGGSVYAESEGEGRGATFTLQLPRLPVSTS